MLYVTTGNSYSVPNGYCVTPGQTNCERLPPDAYIDSVVALRLTTGKIVWAHHTLTADTWTMANPNASPDFDFGADPNLYTTTIKGKMTDVLGAGQKSGMYYALDPATGEEIWATQAGPGGVLGGIEWGTSADGERIYAAITNGSHKTYTYTTYDRQEKTTSGGLWTALDYRPPAPQTIIPKPGHGDMENASRFPHLHTPDDDYGQRSKEALH
jgi:polyvinyl alcohol dehydrogenase (cytochrome)